jgi:hypothetical protein
MAEPGYKKDVLILLKDAVFSRTIGSILKEKNVSFLIEDDPHPKGLQQTFDKFDPGVTVIGAYLAKTRIESNDIENFKVVLSWYRRSYKVKLPILLVYHAEAPDVRPSEEFKKMAYVAKVPEGARTNELTALIEESLRTIGADLGAGPAAYCSPAAAAPAGAPEAAAEKYSEKDFSVEYSMPEHKLVLKGPLIGRTSSRIEMILKNEKVHQDVKMFGDRDRDAKRILKIDWAGVNCVSENAEHYTFVALRDLMKNGIYENIKFLNFESKEQLFSNKTHYELFLNRFCRDNQDE